MEPVKRANVGGSWQRSREKEKLGPKVEEEYGDCLLNYFRKTAICVFRKASYLAGYGQSVSCYLLALSLVVKVTLDGKLKAPSHE